MVSDEVVKQPTTWREMMEVMNERSSYWIGEMLIEWSHEEKWEVEKTTESRFVHRRPQQPRRPGSQW